MSPEAERLRDRLNALNVGDIWDQEHIDRAPEYIVRATVEELGITEKVIDDLRTTPVSGMVDFNEALAIGQRFTALAASLATLLEVSRTQDHAKALLAALDAAKEESGYTPTTKAKFCNQAGPMGGGCKDSWHVGGNHGSHVCKNPNHHTDVVNDGRAAPTETGEPMYPCADCGKLRTKAEGGTTFTVCDPCWDKRRAAPPSDGLADTVSLPTRLDPGGETRTYDAPSDGPKPSVSPEARAWITGRLPDGTPLDAPSDGEPDDLPERYEDWPKAEQRRWFEIKQWISQEAWMGRFDIRGLLNGSEIHSAVAILMVRYLARLRAPSSGESLTDAEVRHYQQLLRDMDLRQEFIHPGYGPCDNFGIHGTCTECTRVLPSSGGERERKQIEELVSVLIWISAQPVHPRVTQAAREAIVGLSTGGDEPSEEER